MKFFLLCVLIVAAVPVNAQKLNGPTNYFVDGYHGGVYGHYPMWVTQFIADNMEQYKDWRLNLEIEPETWDVVALKDPVNYKRMKKLINDSTQNAVAEYVNPTYAQSYFFNSSAESTIRQFQYGMEKLKQHFPLIRFTTYSSEEPCFTSALPQILQSLGIQYASLKNPNTCWGGYVKAYGGQSLNWIGPDGSSILTVPRYSSEALQKKSTWQTTAWNHSDQFLNAAAQQGIEYPVGMCLQDAGWENGPWLNHHQSPSTAYTTWRHYFSLIAHNQPSDNWRLSQEDIHVSLMWGSQILQRISQQVRTTENKIKIAEKLSSLARFYKGAPYPKAELDSAWKSLLLAQHHDCWIVPYNKLNGKTWAEHVQDWTTQANLIAERIIQQSIKKLTGSPTASNVKTITVYNPTSFNREEVVSFRLPRSLTGSFAMVQDGKKIPYQLVKQNSADYTILFKAGVPAFGSSNYSLIPGTMGTDNTNRAFIRITKEGNYLLNTDLYQIIVDAKRGNIKQLIAKQLGNKNFIAAGEEDFNTLRGFFYNENQFAYSFEKAPTISILESGPIQIKLRIEGVINNSLFSQVIQLRQGEKKIDLKLNINYEKEVGIGDGFRQHGAYKAEELRKAFYNDTCKLLVRFPLNLKGQKVYKDAPLDVTESKLVNTFYNQWDEIKNNVLFNWVDITDAENHYGMALLSDHVTSYSHGRSFPLSLTVQYTGIGLWGRNYFIDGPTDIHYSLLPHSGNWHKAQLNKEATVWNEPLIVSVNEGNNIHAPFIKKMDPGLEVTALYYKDADLYIRITNTGSMKNMHRVELNCNAESLHFIELNDKVTSSLRLGSAENIFFDCNIPLFGFKTIKLVNATPKD
ncbi:glycoside hydrolase family 38 C-terminal domain-containing protein [Niabella aquatica]